MWDLYKNRTKRDAIKSLTVKGLITALANNQIWKQVGCFDKKNNRHKVHHFRFKWKVADNKQLLDERGKQHFTPVLIIMTKINLTIFAAFIQIVNICNNREKLHKQVDPN